MVNAKGAPVNHISGHDLAGRSGWQMRKSCCAASADNCYVAFNQRFARPANR